jgi:hypothetical protein
MTTSLTLRIASIIALLFTLGHSVGGLQKWSPTQDNDVLKAMTDIRFEAMGVSRSYLDLYLGLGWSVSVFLLLQTVLLWQMASLARTNAAQLRGMIAAFALAALACGIIAWRLILPVPALFSAALAIALAAACWTARAAPDR